MTSQRRCATRQGCLKQGEVASAAGEVSEPANSAIDDSTTSLLDLCVVRRSSHPYSIGSKDRRLIGSGVLRIDRPELRFLQVQ